MASKTAVVQVSGRGANVDFTIDDSAPFEQVTRGLREYLVENRGLWSSGTIGVNAGRWMQSSEQLAHIKRVIESESGLTVSRFWCLPASLNGGSNGSGLVHNETIAPPSMPLIAAPPDVLASGIPEVSYGIHNEILAAIPERVRLKDSKAVSSRKGLPSEAMFVKATFRSGESITYPGDVVVLADVNPGAEITAEGDIVVFGSLRGMAHAGSAGDTKAVIIALELDSPRIQIGPYTGLAPTDDSESKIMGTGPSIAYARRRSIYVSPYTGRFSRYSRGILYDG